MSYGETYGWKDLDKIDIDSVTETAYRAAINIFWKHLSEEKQDEAGTLYMTQSFMRGAYADKRELAYNRFSHDLVQSEEFKNADKLFEIVNDFVFTNEPSG